MKKIFSYLPFSTGLATLLLRVLFGGLFVRIGYMKITSYNEMLTKFPDLIGIGSKLSLNLVIFAELFCGFLVLIGLLTRLAVIPIFITMVVVFFIAHANDAFDVKSLPFVFLILAVVIFILGGGKFSLDKLLFERKTGVRDGSR